MDTQHRFRRPSTRSIILVVVVFGLLCTAFIYIAAVRIPTSAYDTTLNDLRSLKDKASDLHKSLDNSSESHAVTKQYVSDLQTQLKSYTDLVASIASSRVVQRDSKTKAIYTEQSANLTKFSDAVSTTMSSEKAYLTIAQYCAQFETTAYLTIAGVISDSSRYDSDKMHCQDAVDSIKTLPSSDFKKTFLEAYAATTLKVATSYNDLTQDVTAKRITSKQALSQASAASAQRDSINYAISSQAPMAPTDAINKITSVVASQKSALWR